MTLTQPICLPCWRHPPDDTPEALRAALGGMDRDPPRVSGWPEEHCCLCGRRTNNGIYVRVEPATVPFARTPTEEDQ